MTDCSIIQTASPSKRSGWMKKSMQISVIPLLAVLSLSGCSDKPTDNQGAPPSAGGPSVTAPSASGSPAAISAGPSAGGAAASPQPAVSPADGSLKEFTQEELASYNGTDGKPAYVALNGTVYDVTNAKTWKDGVHTPWKMENVAGKDLTAAMKKAPPSHQKADFMDGIPVVGKLVESTPP